MALDHSLVGVPSEPHRRSWDSKDALLYAVGVGAGLGDPLQELEFTTENSEGIEQQVLPTYARADRAGPRWPQPRRLRPGHAGARRAVLRAAPAAAGGGHRQHHLDRDRHLRQGLGRAGGDRERGGRRRHRRAAGDQQERRVHPRPGRLRRPAQHRPAVVAARPGARPPGRPGRPGRSRRCSTGCPATATRCTSTPSSPPAAASASRSCTACAPTASPAGPCCGCCATATRPGSAPCPAASPARCCRASR